MIDRMTAAAPTPQQLAELLALLRQARQAASQEELRFLLVNGTHALLPYRQAALFEGGRVACLSGTVPVERNAPYVEWLERLAGALTVQAGPVRIDASTLPEPLCNAWSDWLPAEAAWIALDGAGLLVARDFPVSDSELALLAEWSRGWAHALHALRADESRGGWRRWFGSGAQQGAHRPWWRRKLWWALPLLALASAMPVPLTVLAPAELVPQGAEIVRAPLDAVIDHIDVAPNQAVRKGQPLLSFDERVLRSRIEVAAQALATAEADYQQAVQRALSDPQAKAQLPQLAGRIEERRAELGLAESQQGRTRVLASRDGVVLIDDPSAWAGKPVVVGERILRIADPADVEVEAWVPVHDLVNFPEQALVRVHLNSDPLHPVSARMRYLSYDATERPDGSYAYQMRARLEPGQALPRIGAKGTARIESRHVSVGYWLLRKPWAAARAWLGW